MTTLVTTHEVQRCLRPFHAAGDLSRVAGLIERCFADTLDSDGRRYVQQLRMTARNPQFLHLATRGIARGPVPAAGYVWEHGGEIVGNASLISFKDRRQRIFLIANVAVAPEYRRRGIGRALTQACVAYARRHSTGYPWLQVRAENASAIALYRSLGFVTRAERTTWRSTGTRKEATMSAGMKILPRKSQDWPLQRLWFQQAYPEDIQWQFPIDVGLQSPGVLGWLRRLWDGVFIRQWSLYLHGQLLGVLTWEAPAGMHTHIWLSLSPRYEHISLPVLLRFATNRFRSVPEIVFDYPADRGADIIPLQGFANHQTLLWMQWQP
ncbi:MAG: hypothetical protein Fur0018_16960 [Anaerolineales bacterium]